MIILKEIRFNNPNLYISKQLEIGDTILLGISGIWEITGIKNDFFVCGGLTTKFKIGDCYNKVFKNNFLKWIDSLNHKFSKGDLLGGFNRDGEFEIGLYKEEMNQRIVQGKIWIETKKYTTSIDIFSAKKYSMADSFFDKKRSLN